MGKGVSACATCDGFFYRDKNVAVVGGGNTAAEEALYLSNIAKKVYLIHRRDKFRAEAILVDRINKKVTENKIEIIWNNTLEEILGDDSGVTAIKIKSTQNSSNKVIDVHGVCDITEEKIIARELALIKVQSTPETRSDIIQIAQMFRAHIVDVGTNSIVVEVTGSEDKIAALQDLLSPYTVIQMMRTGRVAMTRSNNKEI